MPLDLQIPGHTVTDLAAELYPETKFGGSEDLLNALAREVREARYARTVLQALMTCEHDTDWLQLCAEVATTGMALDRMGMR